MGTLNLEYQRTSRNLNVIAVRPWGISIDKEYIDGPCDREINVLLFLIHFSVNRKFLGPTANIGYGKFQSPTILHDAPGSYWSYF